MLHRIVAAFSNEARSHKMGICVLYALLYLISLNRIRASDCPSKHCICDSPDQWRCNIETDDDHIDCIQWTGNFHIRVHLELISDNRNRVLFANGSRCKIQRLLIKTNRIPMNNWIRNLNALEVLIVQEKFAVSHGFQMFDNLLSELTSLKKVKIENHPLQKWSKEILNPCYNVNEISLKNLGLENIETRSFASCTSLTSLEIGFNKLSVIFTSILHGLSELIFLNLSQNLLKRIITNGNGWWEVRKLKKLDLSYNAFDNLQAKSFIGLVNLEQLVLNNNELDFIDRYAFEGLTKLSTLNLGNNPKLILFDLVSLIPMSRSLNSLIMDVSFTQCINEKSKLNRFQNAVQLLLKDSRDCNTNLMTSSTVATLVMPIHHQDRVMTGNFTLIITLAVIITILVLGVIFFLAYFCTTRKKIRRYKNSDGITIRSSSSKTCAHQQEGCSITCSSENPHFYSFRNNTRHDTYPMIPRFCSTPALPNRSEPLVNVI